MNQNFKKIHDHLKRIIPMFVFASLVMSIVFTIFKIIVAPSGYHGDVQYQKIKSDYVLMLIQCLLGLGALMLPTVLNHKWQIVLPSSMMLFYVVFLYCAIYLGEVRSFYYRIPHWDTILHTFSGVMLGALGFSVVHLLNNSKGSGVYLSPLFVSMFAFFFAVSLGVLWEIYEFTFDGLLGLNMQKYLMEDGTQLLGRAAISDTMKDLIVDTVGAFVMSAIGYFSINRQSDWLDQFEIKKNIEDR